MSSPASALKLENVLYDKKGPIAYVTINRPKVHERSEREDHFRIAIRVRRRPRRFRRAWSHPHAEREISRLRPARTSAKWPTILALTGRRDNAVRARRLPTSLKTLASRSSPLSMVLRSVVAANWRWPCTIRIAAETAKFGQPEVKIGVMPRLWRNAASASGWSARAGRLQLILSGEIIDAARGLSHRPGG